MKKNLTIAALALTLVLSLAACGGGKDSNNNLDTGLANNGMADGGAAGSDVGGNSSGSINGNNSGSVNGNNSGSVNGNNSGSVNGNGTANQNGDNLLDDVEDGADDLARSARNAARDMMR